MNENLRAHVEKLFERAPKTRRAVELKEELLANLTDRYNDLLSRGIGEADAFKAVAESIGDVDELIKGLKETDVMDYNQMLKERKKTARVVTTAIGLILFGVILMITSVAALHADPVIMNGIMLLIFLCATCMLVYHFMSRPKYVKADDTIVEEFKEWKSKAAQDDKIRKSIHSILWTSTVAVYFLVSFLFHIWAYSWILFIIAAVVSRIITLSFQLKESEKGERP
ncbi:MAG: permease prefix domain 1-containing protein [Bacillota bacterium]